MSSLNRVTLIGNLGRDPETRRLQNGGMVCNLSVACSERWKDKNSGEQREKTEWISVVLFGNLADIAERFLTKGSKVYIEGKFSTRKWQDQSGNDRYSTEVVCQGFDGKLVMLGGKEEGSGEGGGQLPPAGRNTPHAGELDDGIPFNVHRGL